MALDSGYWESPGPGWKYRTIDAFGLIASYNGYEEWLWEIADALTTCPKDRFYPCPVPTEEWNTVKHSLWMLLVGLFGNWGNIHPQWLD